MKNIPVRKDIRAGPVQCLNWHRTGYPWSPANYSTKPEVCRRVKPYGTRSLMWTREQYRRKIPTGASLTLWARNRTGDTNRTGPVVGCDWGMIYNLFQITDSLENHFIKSISASVYVTWVQVINENLLWLTCTLELQLPMDDCWPFSPRISEVICKLQQCGRNTSC